MVFLSPEALESDWVANELAVLGVDAKARGRVVVPVLVDGLGWADVRRALPAVGVDHLQGVPAGDVAAVLAALEPTRKLLRLPQGLHHGQARRRPRSPANLLRAGQETVAFALRSQSLAWLDGWLDGPRRADVALVHGEGGTGKTRLALQLVAQRNVAGWTAGFLDADHSRCGRADRGDRQS